MHRFNRALFAIGVVAGVGCRGDLATSPTHAVHPSFSSALPPCHPNPELMTNWKFNIHWSCGQALDLVASGTSQDSLIDIVENAWNSALHAQELNLPYFSNTVFSRHVIKVGQQSGTSNFAGSVFPQNCSQVPDSINLANGTNGAFLPVLFVESSHVMGYCDDWESPGKVGNVAGVTDHCVRVANAQSIYTNTTPCQHEIEGIYAAYGLRLTMPDSHKHIITGIWGLPTSTVTLRVRDTLPLAVTSLQFQRVNPSLCGYSSCPEEEPSRAVLIWTATGTAISLHGSANAQRTLEAVAPGTATVTVTFAAADTNEVTALFGTSFSPNSFDVIVLDASPPPPSNITASAVSSTSATINWTNGDPSATTVVEYQYAGQGGWSQVTATAGATSITLAGLQPSTAYSVQLYHTRNGLNSSLATASNLFQTTAQPLDIWVVSDHLSGALGNVRQNQACLWQAQGTPSGIQWTWQLHQSGWPPSKWVYLTDQALLSQSVGTASYQLRVIGTLNGATETVSFTVTPTSSGPVCTGTLIP